MKRLKLVIILFVALSFLLTSCSSDLVEIDEEVYPLIIGADLGVHNKVRITIQFPTYKGGTGVSSSGTKKEGAGGSKNEDIGEIDGTIVSTIEASSILEGINLLNTSVARNVSLSHCKMIVFAEDFARSGIGDYLSPLMRYRETRRIMHVVVCKGKAENFIKQNIAVIGESASKAIELMVTQSQNSGIFPRETFIDFYRNMLSTYQQGYCAFAGVNDYSNLDDSTLPNDKPPLKVPNEFYPGDIPRHGGVKREFVGTAIFEGDKMVGALSSFETRCLMLVKGDFKRGIFTLEDKNAPNKAIPVDIRVGRKPKIKVRFEEGIPIIDLTLNIESDLGAIQSRINYERLDMIEDLENQVEEFIQTGMQKLVTKTQQLNSDVLGFGEQVAWHFPTIQEWEKYHWPKHYKEAKVNVKVNVSIRRTGLMFGSYPIKRSSSGISEEEK